MASTYSANLRLELIGTGEQQGTWGSTTNTNLGSLLEQAIGGYESITVSDVGDTTLTTANGSVDQARNMTLNLVGTIGAARNVICPAAEKIYIVKNSTTGGFAVTFKVTGQTGVSIPNGSTSILYVDGTDARLVSQNPVPVTLGGTGAATSAAAATNLGLGTGDSPQFAGVNVGNASDTTITRSAAGVLAVEGGVVPLENRANTFTNSNTFSATGASYRLRITSGSGNGKYTVYQTGGSTRWETGSSSSAETGSNAGSSYQISRYDDTGTFVDTPLVISRQSGAVGLNSGSYVGGSTGATNFYVSGGAGNNRSYYLQTNFSTRWQLKTDSTAESGSNSGSNFDITRYDDSGNSVASALAINRATGLTTLESLSVTGAASVGGILSAPTAAVDTNTTQAATTAYVIGQGYLKSATAASTYLTSATAASTYLTSATASSTYAPRSSPALTGTPTAPTATVGTNTTQIATTAFVMAATPTGSFTQYTSGSGNWTVPSSGTFAFVRTWAGGGSGGANPGTTVGGGGGGAYKERLYRLSDLGTAGASIAYVVGAGGANVNTPGSGNTPGNVGGNTTFASGGNLLTAYGGGGGTGGGTPAGGTSGGWFAAGGIGAIGTGPLGGSGVTSGADAGTQWAGANGGVSSGTDGGAALYGGGGGGGAGTTGSSGGTSYYGGSGGLGGSTTTSGTAGSSPSGGGGGTRLSGGTSGAGGSGRIEIYTW